MIKGFWSKNHKMHSLISLTIPYFKGFLAHLSRGLKWAFLIKICPVSVAIVVVNFSHFYLLQNHWDNFKQTWHKPRWSAFKFVKMNSEVPFKGGNLCIFFKNLLNNQLVRQAVTLMEASSGTGNSSLFKLWSQGWVWGHNGEGGQIFALEYIEKNL